MEVNAMKKMTKLSALLLSGAMVLGLLGGCGDSSTTSAEAPASTTQEATEVSKEETVAETPEAVEPSEDTEVASAAPEESAPEEETVQRVDYTLPLYEEPDSFTYWTILQGADESNSTFQFWQRLATETGIDVEFVDAPEETATEKYNLMIASGDLADVICEKGLTQGTSSSCPYPGGYAKAITDDIYLDLTDVIPEQIPNYWYYLQEDADLYRELTLEDGTLYCVAQIYDEPYGPNQGAWVRTDMMAEVGYTEIPTTPEGWLELWTAMKDANVVEQPTRASNLGDLYPNIAEAFGTTASSNFLVNRETGEVFYDIISDEYRAYLEYFRQVIEAGLVSKDFYSVSETSMQDIDGGLIATYECVLGAANMMTQNGIEMAAAPAVHLSDTTDPKLIDYETWSSRLSQGVWCAISASTEKLDVITTWFDFLFSDYGIQVCNYGFDEGVSYEVLDDGSLQLTPAMTERDENMIVGRMQYTMKEGPSLMYSQIEMPISSDFLKESYSTWCDFDKDAAIYSTLPTGVSLSESESTEVSSLMSDIETYASTVTMQWMTCDADLNDETWNEYVEYIKSSGIDDVLQAYQSAYDRYLSK
jgi:putative aldouronate transport system substrate-binding protein